MVTVLVKGQNGPLATGEVVVSVRTEAAVDVSALLVSEAGRVRDDADFVFFNQPEGPGVRLGAGAPAAVEIRTAQVPADIAQVRVVLTLDQEGARFGDVAPPVVTVADRAGAPLFEYRIDGLGGESVVIAIEVYRRGADWKVRAVGQGYAGGFADLVTDHGVSVDDEPAPTQPAPTQPAPPRQAAVSTAPPLGDGLPVRSVPDEAKLSFDKRATLDLRKREVAKVLLTKQAVGVRARVVLVIDKTGSMAKMYEREVMHRVVERMVPIAIQLDDDGRLEPYLYAVDYLKLPDITVAESDRWSQTYLHLSGRHGGHDYAKIGGRNVEPPVMRAVVDSLRPGQQPTLVLFFTDGGFAKKREIAALIRESSALPAFWQFIGLGKANYGLLRELDELDGRVVDNAGFFALDDIDEVDDAQLYTRLLGEFPEWLRAAKAAGVVR
ncbi:MAG TPA: VWA domain-containing protein [Nocardia sp.]|uniref:vWA domain-containing protein n=1 Tax=Nocardia TaxID=1817 RepID=UPI00245888D3|nr:MULTISPECIES: VWA domain-containing protein [Nocardia]HLS78147.1 VWA domain-containing protein [Nocardia sp.]